MKKIAIIGAGASGLMAGVFAARAGADVTLFEHNSAAGKKILASGNGRCNIINTTASAMDYAGADPHFVSYALKQLSFAYFEKLCLSIGILLDIRDDGRCYPLSNEAKAVQNALRTALETSGGKILIDTRVESLSKEGDAFIVVANGKQTRYDRVLIATGSEAAPQLGATPDGYRFARGFGHEVLPTYPSLVQLHADTPPKLAGIKISGTATLIVDGKAQARVEGDILFAPYGLSGLAILDISQQASHALLNGHRVEVSLNLLPRYDTQALSHTLQTLFASVPEYPLSITLGTLLSAKTIPFLLKEAGIAESFRGSELGTKQIKQLARLIGDWRFRVNDTHGFKHAEVSGGGVSTAQINPKTMESNLVKGLYFAGEVLDIVGRRGGFNFHFAWASGMIAGKEMAK